MNYKSGWGHPDRWLIRKVRSGWNARAWYITAAGTYEPGWVFRTGAEALAAFAKGETLDGGLHQHGKSNTRDAQRVNSTLAPTSGKDGA